MTETHRIEPIWLDAKDAMAIHDRQLSEHGGGVGIRDAALLESALARPRHRWVNGDDDPAHLAASYAFGIARNHPFVDGNKRTAWVMARLFLAINNHDLRFDKINATHRMIDLAAGELTEEEITDWFRQHLVAA